MLIADVKNPLTPDLDLTPKGGNSVSQFSAVLAVVIKTMFVVGIVLFVFYFIIGAYQWITSSGDAKGVEKARNSIIHALIGLVVMFALFAILKLIGDIFGFDILQIDLSGIKL